jgi:hypothetical protein
MTIDRRLGTLERHARASTDATRARVPPPCPALTARIAWARACAEAHVSGLPLPPRPVAPPAPCPAEAEAPDDAAIARAAEARRHVVARLAAIRDRMSAAAATAASAAAVAPRVEAASGVDGAEAASGAATSPEMRLTPSQTPERAWRQLPPPPRPIWVVQRPGGGVCEVSDSTGYFDPRGWLTVPTPRRHRL